ncbi:MAG TPA: LLM class flavin-dependent oxidoreductase [Candidatus Limnocylindrales bacterium]|nr:LLM class flavin-dependent oxidoreductase [Candidatus Limnocylindrales bacterium]
MPDQPAPLRLGVLCWNQYTDWPALLEVGVRADALGYDTLWTWDHVYPIVGSPVGPMYEGWLTITAWAMATKRARIGLMVGANPYREPTLVAKMATTLDHISGGRAILGIGAAWFDGEAHDFGFAFGDGPPERLRWLGEALPVMRGMLDGTEPSASGPRYAADHVRNLPAPIQDHLPICVGGGGEKVTLRLVARYADLCNIGGGVERVQHRDAVLRQHCEAVGRDEREIERTTGVGCVVIRDSEAEARRVFEAIFEHNGAAREWTDQPVGTPEQVAEKLAPYLDLGYRHLIAGVPAPYDEESMTRFATEVRGLLGAG